MTLLEALRERRAQILEIAAKHGAYNVRVFGSVVRGEETPDSDIDFLIDYDLEKITPWFPGGLLMDLQDLLGRKVDVLTERGLSPLIRERVLAEAKPPITVHDDRVYLEHILDCAERIRNYTGGGKLEFMGSVLVQDAVLRRLQTMAESIQRLSDGLKAEALEVDWRALSVFRNVLVYDYLGGIDLEHVWDAVEIYLPGWKPLCGG